MFATSFSGGVLTLHSQMDTLQILPGIGALLNNWEHRLPDGQTLSLIEGYGDAADAAAHFTEKGFRSAKLSPYVCRMREGRYQFADQHYQVGGFYLGDSAIHGLVYQAPFRVESHHADDQSANGTLVYHYLGDDTGYPFSYTLTVTYRLEYAHRLSIETRCTNNSTVAIPLCDGWHPYFRLGATVDELLFEMDSRQMVTFDEGLLPTGELEPYPRFQHLHPLKDVVLDNCFLLEGKKATACRLVNPVMGLALSVEAVHGYPYLQLYTPPHRQSIAIENLSAAPDAFNNGMGLLVLQSGGEARFETAYQLLRE